MTDEERAAQEAVVIVKDAGGYISFDDYDAVYSKPDKFRFQPWIVGWGSMDSMINNNGVLSAFAAVDLGLLTKGKDGYRLVVK